MFPACGCCDCFFWFLCTSGNFLFFIDQNKKKRSLSSVTVATTNTSGITARLRLRKHHRSVYGNLRVPRPSRNG